MTIGDLIRAARKSRGLTQNELAHAMGITGSVIGQYECGARKPKYETVERISSALSVPTSSLMPGVSSENERLTARCARYAEEIAVAQERTRWIPVSERLPEDRSNVLVVADWLGRWGFYMSSYNPERAEWSIHVGIRNRSDVAVVYWFPLPELPEVE